VQEDAHARFHATQRKYFYYLSKQKNPFRDNFTWYVYGDLDFDLMNKAAEILLEYEDFTSFSKLHTDVKTNICRITMAEWTQVDEVTWVFTIRADRFLRNMVRAIVGTLLEVGRGKMTVQDFKQVIELQDRGKAGTSAPGQALFLVNVEYPENLFID
jgi:tRNA pseudouridine38-40 synthase